MASQLTITKKQASTEEGIKRRLEQIQLKMVDAGYDPKWNVYINTLGWFTSKKHLTEEQQQIIQSWWSSVYGTTITTIKEKLSEEAWIVQLNLNLMKNAR